ncbi:cytochrome c oxidase subunit 7B, mitochondrial-like [Heterocephalus glaber]|uniref:Cytochrome c oxidase subunit 7B, mitochondrial n=1 Tax=Heterocephalus glaber TaxID=10181 RepID=A0AAX6PE41_HETGA|nr:cytochrome c oxidase subunit 7B, mitochondrial-like [Heterocephalus glaber]
MMFPLAKWALLNGLKRQTIQCCSKTNPYEIPNFHDKYGNTVLASGAIFCVVTWVFLTTQVGILWNPSPVAQATPKEWKNK